MDRNDGGPAGFDSLSLKWGTIRQALAEHDAQPAQPAQGEWAVRLIGELSDALDECDKITPLCDCRDNDGDPYPSQWLADVRAKAAGFLSAQVTAPQPAPAPVQVDDARWQAIIERDRYVFAIAIELMKSALQGRRHLREGRAASGYAWDEQGFCQEFTAAVDEIDAVLAKLRTVSGSFESCTRDEAAIRAARAQAREFFQASLASKPPAPAADGAGDHVAMLRELRAAYGADGYSMEKAALDAAIAALQAQQPGAQVVESYWCAINYCGTVEYGQSIGDVAGGESERRTVNDYINDQPNVGELHLRKLYTRPQPPSIPEPSAEQEWRAAFIAGAKWWEWEKTGATMWQSDQQLAYDKAGEKFAHRARLRDKLGEQAPGGDGDA